MTDPRHRRQKSTWGVAGEVSSLATTFAFAVLIGLFGGKWIGGKLGHEDIGILVGLVIGTAAAFLELARVVKNFGAKRTRTTNDQTNDQDDGQGNGKTGEG